MTRVQEAFDTASVLNVLRYFDDRHEKQSMQYPIPGTLYAGEIVTGRNPRYLERVALVRPVIPPWHRGDVSFEPLQARQFSGRLHHVGDAVPAIGCGHFPSS